MANTAKFYDIRTLTNLHVGSGDTNYGVIDNLVQRDVNTGLPTIHSSSLKGALREFFRISEKSRTSPVANEQNLQESTMIKAVFGYIDDSSDKTEEPDKKDKTKKKKSHAGEWQFLSADLLSRPLRSDKVPYFNATSPGVVKQLVNKFDNLGLTVPAGLLKLLSINKPEPGKPLVFDRSLDGAHIEEVGWKARHHELDLTQYAWLTAVLGDRLVLVSDQDFSALELPVIARNHLENGESKNLWYEELVPYDARFGVFIMQSSSHTGAFDKALEEHIQIGANASVGYGLCKLTGHQVAVKKSEAKAVAL